MTSGSSHGASFLTSEKLSVAAFINGQFIDTKMPDLKAGSMAKVRLDFSQCEVSEILKECKLTEKARLAMSFQVSCDAFRLKKTFWRLEFLGNDSAWLKQPIEVDVPSNFIRAGGAFHVQLVLIDSDGCVDGPGACTVSGGVLSSWSRNFEAMNAGGVFPVIPGKVPSLWSLDLAVSDIEDLEKPLGAAVRLRIDADFFRGVFESKDRTTRERAEDLLMAEVLTAMVLAVASKEELADYFDKKSANNSKEGADPRTLEAFLDLVLTHVSTSLGVLAEEINTDALGVSERVRGEMARLVGIMSKVTEGSAHGR